MRKEWEYEAVNVLLPQGHEHRSLLFVVGELHPDASIAKDTQKKLGKVIGIDCNEGSVCVNFEDGFVEFYQIPHVEITIGQVKK